ncbi:MAG: TonB-dependent receptor [Gammaproteobacteria bacterium]|nr:TonB-dependent receptor [Gammaproteobacteria bacterium]
MPIFFRFAAILFLFFAQAEGRALFADTTRQSIEPLTIVITGSNIPVTEHQGRTTTTIVTRQEIEQLNAPSVSRLLNLLPGFHVENSSSRGSVNAVYLRGAEPNYTAVLTNGVKVNDPANNRGGAFDFSLIDINSIERIEIVKGPVSSLYGSDAMAGVINIITRPPQDELKTNIRTEAGSNDLFNASALTGHAFAGGHVTLKASHADDGEQIEGSGYKADSANFGGDFNLRDDTTLSVHLSIQEAEAQSFPDASGGPEYAVNREVDKRDTGQQYHYLVLRRDINGTNHVNLQFNYFQTQEQADTVEITPIIPAVSSDSDYQRQNLLAVYTGKPTPQLDASIGGELEWEEGTSNSVIDPEGLNIPADFNLERRLAALFGELQYQFNERLRTYAGVRVDSPENMPGETSPRLGLSYQQNNTVYRVDWGRGFKLPSFYALGHPLVGNADFQPETSESVQLTLQHTFTSSTLLDIAAFWNRYYDLIDFDNTSNVLVQRPEAGIKGAEIVVKHRFAPSLLMQLQYTGMSMDIVDSDEVLLKRPDKLGSFVLNWNINHDLLCSISANYVGGIKDASIPTGLRTLDSYTRVDASLGWQINKHWFAQGAVDNVLDEDYEEAIGFNAPGIGMRISISATF